MKRYYVCFLYLKEEGKTASRSHSRSHSRTHSRTLSRSSSQESTGSKFSNMSEEDFETEAKKRGWVKSGRAERSEATSKGTGEGSSKGCFGDCFGSGRKKEDRVPLDTVYEESDQNFEFRPHTQLQYAKPDNQRAGYETPTPIDVKTPPINTAETTPINTTTTTPLGTPPRTPFRGYV